MQQRVPGSGTPADDDGRDVPELVEHATGRNGSRAFWGGAVLGGLLAVATALLIVQNGRSVGFSWLTADLRAPLWLLLLAAAVSGAVLDRLAVLLWRYGRARAAQHADARDRLRHLVADDQQGRPG